MPLPEKPGAIPMTVENGRERRDIAPQRKVVGRHTRSVRIEPGDHCRSAGGAHRCRRIRTRAEHSLLSQSVEIRRGYHGPRPPHLGLLCGEKRAVAADRAEVVFIRNDQEHVWGICLRFPPRKPQHQDQQHSCNHRHLLFISHTDISHTDVMPQAWWRHESRRSD
jgi:hypothetical protein